MAEQASLFPELQELAERKRLESLIKQAQFWRTLGRIACRRFPELQRGEKVGRYELLKVYQALKYRHCPKIPVNFRRMSRDELWNNLVKKVRPVLYSKMGQYCPDVLVEIKSSNERQIEEADLYR